LIEETREIYLSVCVTQDAELSQLKTMLHSLQHQAKQEFDERALRRQHSLTASSASGLTTPLVYAVGALLALGNKL